MPCLIMFYGEDPALTYHATDSFWLSIPPNNYSGVVQFFDLIIGQSSKSTDLYWMKIVAAD